MYHITQYAHCITAIKQTMIDRGRNVVIPPVPLLLLGSSSKDNNALCKELRDCHLVSTTCWVWKVGAQGDKGITWKFCRGNFWSFGPILNWIWRAH